MLYQLSYASLRARRKSGVRESNPCKSAWKADAQPLGQPHALIERLPQPLYGTPANRVNLTKRAARCLLCICRATGGGPGIPDRHDSPPAAPKFTTAGLPSIAAPPVIAL